MSTQNTLPASQLSQAELKRIIDSRPWWHRIEIAPGLVTPGLKDTPTELRERIGLPKRLDGKTVLDIGAAEGFYSFECEKRGALVTAVDVLPADYSGFGLVRALLGSPARHVHGSIYNLDPARIGTFDLVLCLGVIYHLRYPLLALDTLYSICKDELILESQICDRYFVRADRTTTTLRKFSPELTHLPLAQFYPADELNHDITNWWAPNEIGLRKMLETSGFESRVQFSDGIRIVLHCRKVERSTPATQWATREVESVKNPTLEFG